MRKFFRLWAKALGPKEGSNQKEADAVALIRTCLWASYFVTNCFIVLNAVHNLKLLNERIDECPTNSQTVSMPRHATSNPIHQP